MSNNKYVLITGSTDGIGKKAALDLAKSGAHVIVHGRNRQKAELTLEQIKNQTKLDNISAVYADLSSFDQIKEMAYQIKEKYERLDVLINNAGVYRQNRQLTEEGLEETFAINYIAPFLLTNLLLDSLKKANSSRIVNVASQVQSNHLDLDNLQFEKGYTGVKAYASSKTCLILFTYLLAEKLKNSDIMVNCLHPGVINTKLLNVAWGAIGAPVSEGAKNLIYVAMAPKLEKVSGKYFENKHIKPSKDITYDKELQRKLWKKTEEIIGLKFNNLIIV
ncbi:MAG: SDR family oxidoreductase [Promethearchaeota archaeon]